MPYSQKNAGTAGRRNCGASATSWELRKRQSSFFRKPVMRSLVNARGRPRVCRKVDVMPQIALRLVTLFVLGALPAAAQDAPSAPQPAAPGVVAPPAASQPAAAREPVQTPTPATTRDALATPTPTDPNAAAPAAVAGQPVAQAPAAQPDPQVLAAQQAQAAAAFAATVQGKSQAGETLSPAEVAAIADQPAMKPAYAQRQDASGDPASAQSMDDTAAGGAGAALRMRPPRPRRSRSGRRRTAPRPAIRVRPAGRAARAGR